MIKINRRNSHSRLLVTAALPLGLMAAGIAPAFAASVTVTGANGAPGAPGQRGGAGGSATATATSSGPSNSATATGGNGGNGEPGRMYYYFPGPGGVGGAASSRATASSANGSASATATSTGGNGGLGGPPIYPCIHSCFRGRGGAGGAASAVSSATGGVEGTVASSATAHGGAGGFLGGAPGHASAGASALSSGQEQVEADASAFSWGGGASVTASAKNPSGSIVTTAAAPPGSGALYGAVAESLAVEPAPVPVVAISAGQAFSNAALTLGGGSIIGVGTMSAGYVLSTAATYEATAVFNFTARSTGSLDLDLFSYKVPNVSGIDFDSLELQVVADGTTRTYDFNSLTGAGGAEAFFTAPRSIWAMSQQGAGKAFRFSTN